MDKEQRQPREDTDHEKITRQVVSPRNPSANFGFRLISSDAQVLLLAVYSGHPIGCQVGKRRSNQSQLHVRKGP